MVITLNSSGTKNHLFNTIRNGICPRILRLVLKMTPRIFGNDKLLPLVIPSVGTYGYEFFSRCINWTPCNFHIFHHSEIVIDSLDGKRERLVRSMAHVLEAQYDQTLVEHRITLFAGNAFIECLHAILKSDQHLNAMESQWAALNIITKVAEWLILNNISLPVDDQFLICAWRTLNLYSCNSSGLKFHSTEIIRLLSHSIFGYPNEIEQHQNVCTCKRIPIDWNGAALLFTSFDDISNG